MCKPNKMGWAPARTDRERMEERAADDEMDEIDPEEWDKLVRYLDTLPEDKSSDPDDILPFI